MATKMTVATVVDEVPAAAVPAAVYAAVALDASENTAVAVPMNMDPVIAITIVMGVTVDVTFYCCAVGCVWTVCLWSRRWPWRHR